MKAVSSNYRNQRLGRPKQRRQQHLLEVSLRADKERERKMRRALGVICKLVLWAALGAGAWFGTKQAMRRFVWENPAFSLADPRVATDGTLTKEQILATAGIVEGRNIFLFNLAQARAALDALPQVERVEIQRTLPNRIDIEITERQPIAWIAARGDVDPTTSDRSFLVDSRGFVIKSRKRLPDYYSLPVITGVETENLTPGQKIAAFEVQAALELIRLNTDSTRWQALSVDVSKGYCLVVTDRTHAHITFGLDNIEKQLERLYRLLEVVEPQNKEIQTVNLFVERNMPVTFVDPLHPPGAAALSPPADGPALSSEPSSPLKPKVDGRDKAAGAAPPLTQKTNARNKSGNASWSGRKSSGEAVKKPFRL